jgi:acyl carrier protein
MKNAYNEILEKLTNVIVEQLNVDSERVTIDANFYNRLLAEVE